MVGRGLKLSVVIPSHNEAGSIVRTLEQTAAALDEAGIDYELRVVDDASSDDTAAVVGALAAQIPALCYESSRYPRGFGFTVRYGLDTCEGDAVCVMMADASDAPADVVAYYRLLESGYDCAFGSRFVRGAKVTGYPRFKLALNQAVNTFIRPVFRHGYNDTTNAFKAYKREVIETAQPLLSNHFKLSVELPLKALVRGHSYGVIPVSWTNRDEGVSKLKLQEIGSRYPFIVLYVFLEHHLSRGDYRRAGSGQRRLRPGLHGTAGCGGRAV